jgi:hypothetical protein
MILLRPEHVWTYHVTRHHRPLLSPSGSTNWEPHGVTLAGYCYAKRHVLKVQIVTPYRVSHWQRYGVTVRGYVTSLPTFTVLLTYGYIFSMLKAIYSRNM